MENGGRMWQSVCEQISEITGERFVQVQSRSVGGGCINSAQVLDDGRRRFFVKYNNSTLLSMFEAEFDGLLEIAQSNSVRVPTPYCSGVSGKAAYLVLEYLPIHGRSGDSASMEKLGWDLVAMHQTTQNQFGWYRDNTIGSTPQLNLQTSQWIDFLRTQRLGFQFDLAAQNGFGRALKARGEKLLANIDSFFSGYAPKPSLLHGDLWSGNCALMDDKQAVIFDPAVYYGDREADLAMTELFGGFPACFYTAYNERWPLDEGYSTRKVLYNLYHILNHLNLFGGGYLSQAQSMIDKLLSEIK